ncbi:MAG: hypothetical protein NTX24_04865 [Candidatus Pacearchaeota archaeon]|nr:hypothetical protein [Candidatus Pacearchaeota archaeon]
MAKKDLENIREKLKEMKSEDLANESSIKIIKDIKKEIARILKDARKKEIRAENKIGKEILIHFKKPFTKEDAFQRFIPEYSKEEIIKALRKLIREKSLELIRKDLYSAQIRNSEPIIRLSPEMENVRKTLNDNGISFLITGLDVLQEYVNLIPKRMLHLVYVADGSGDFVKNLIVKKTGKMCIINPSRKEIRDMFSHYAEDIIIVREVGESAIEYNNKGIAMIEKAIVDLYFETTRKRIPFEVSELTSILKNTLLRLKIDYRRLLRAASRRNLQSEFIRIFEALGLHIPYEKIKESANDQAEKVIRMLK